MKMYFAKTHIACDDKFFSPNESLNGKTSQARLDQLEKANLVRVEFVDLNALINAENEQEQKEEEQKVETPFVPNDVIDRLQNSDLAVSAAPKVKVKQ